MPLFARVFAVAETDCSDFQVQKGGLHLLPNYTECPLNGELHLPAELTSHSRPVLSWQRAELISRSQTQYGPVAKLVSFKHITHHVRVSGRTSRRRGRVSFFAYLVSSSDRRLGNSWPQTGCEASDDNQLKNAMIDSRTHDNLVWLEKYCENVLAACDYLA